MNPSFILMLTVISLLSGCSAVVQDCLSMAPEGNWKQSAKPSQEISSQFSYEEEADNIWFQLNESTYGLCNTCGDYAPDRASSFQAIDVEKVHVPGDLIENKVITTCGPY